MRFSRNFCFMMYDDSMNADFISVLSDFGEKAFIVYHDRDVNPDGTQKKPHYHVMVMCKTTRSVNSVQKLVDDCGGANGAYKAIKTKRGYARYLCHMDNPEKMPYAPDEVMCLCGADYLSLAMTKSDVKCNKLNMLRQIIRYCRDNSIIYYCDMVDYCTEERQEWLPVLASSYGRVVRNYIQSLDYSGKKRGV